VLTMLEQPNNDKTISTALRNDFIIEPHHKFEMLICLKKQFYKGCFDTTEIIFTKQSIDI